MSVRWVLLGMALAFGLGARVSAKGISGIVVDTDRSVNCATVETIVADVTAGAKSDRDKAVAIYNFVVRTVWMPYVYGQPKEMIGGKLASVRDPLKVLNVYGAAGCDIQADVFCTLAASAGLKARRLNPGFAHGSSEIGWGGKWHWMDVWLPCYLTDEKGEIYSYDDLMADRSLIDKAVADGRVSENFMFNPAPDLKAVKGAKGHRPDEPGSGVKRCRYKENLSLRPGESCTWMWDHVGKWYWPGERFACPAFKFSREQTCKQAFPFWEPYRKRIPKGPHPWKDIYYRYYGNAVFVCQPPLTRKGLADIGAQCANVAFADGAIKPAKPGDAAVEIAFALPYVIADSRIEGIADLGQDAAIRIEYSLDGGKTWLASRSPVRTGGRFGPISIGKPNSRDFPADSTSGQYAYALRLTLTRGAALKSLKITNTTMLNFQSRPWLETGKNKVTVFAAGGDLAATPLEIRWKWLEDWTEEKSFTHKVDKNGRQATIEVGGRKRPKMKSVTIACPAR